MRCITVAVSERQSGILGHLAARFAYESEEPYGAKTLRFQCTANGWSSLIGQTYGLAEDWPHFEVADYTRAIDYDAKWSREDYTRRQGKYPLLGRPPMSEEHVTSILSGNYAWDMQ